MSNTRVENIRFKFEGIVPQLKDIETKDEAYAQFSSYFTDKQLKFLDIMLERYYNNTTGTRMGEEYGCTREYIRQCEEKALQIISLNIL